MEGEIRATADKIHKDVSDFVETPAYKLSESLSSDVKPSALIAGLESEHFPNGAQLLSQLQESIKERKEFAKHDKFSPLGSAEEKDWLQDVKNVQSYTNTELRTVKAICDNYNNPEGLQKIADSYGGRFGDWLGHGKDDWFRLGSGVRLEMALRHSDRGEEGVDLGLYSKPGYDISGRFVGYLPVFNVHHLNRKYNVLGSGDPVLVYGKTPFARTD